MCFYQPAFMTTLTVYVMQNHAPVKHYTLPFTPTTTIKQYMTYLQSHYHVTTDQFVITRFGNNTHPTQTLHPNDILELSLALRVCPKEARRLRAQKKTKR